MENTRLKVIRAKCELDLEFFIRYFFKERNGRKFILNWHHKKIIDTLKQVLNGEIKRLIINMPPRYGKTEIAVKGFIAYCISKNPKAKFIHLSYSDTLALDNSEEIKDLLTSSEFKQIFGDCDLKKDSTSKKKWYTKDKGGVYATSSAGQVTGFGAGNVEDEEENELNDLFSLCEKEFNGAIVIDDPIKPDDANSTTLRGAINNKFDSTIRSRVNSRNTPIIIIMQRVHEMDLSGYLMDIEPNEWHVLSLPAISEDGVPLWENKHTLKELKHLETINRDVFLKQYMQNPINIEGLLFPKSELNHYTTKEIEGITPDSTAVFTDVADQGKDYFCSVFGKIINERVYIYDVIFSKLNTDITTKILASKIIKDGVKFSHIETNSMGAKVFRDVKQATGIGTGSPASGNKETRMLTYSGHVIKYFYFLNEAEQSQDYKAYYKQLTTHLIEGKNLNDDAPDATCGLSIFLQAKFKHLWEFNKLI